METLKPGPDVVSNQISEVYQITTSLEAIHGKRREVDVLGIWQSPVDLRVYDSGDSNIYSMFFPENQYYGKEFQRILTWARPKFREGSRTPQNPLGVLDDWQINSDYLEGLHKALEPYWSDWNASDKAKYIAAISAPTQEEYQTFFDRFESSLIAKEKAQANIVDIINEHETDTYINTQGHREYRWQPYGRIRDFLVDEYRFLAMGNEGDGLTIGKKQIPLEDLEGEEGRLLVRHLFKEYAPQDEDFRKRLGNWYNLLHIYGYRIVDSSGNIGGGTILNSSYDNLGIPCRIDYLPDGNMRVRISNAWALYRADGDEVVQLEKSPQEDGEIHALKPWIVWKINKQTGERQTIISDIPAELLSAVDNKANARLGLLAATALSRKQRDTLPSKGRLPGSKINQPMREAQTVLVSPMWSQRILVSPFFKNTELFLQGFKAAE